jgi:hypothetical protein
MNVCLGKIHIASWYEVFAHLMYVILSTIRFRQTIESAKKG